MTTGSDLTSARVVRPRLYQLVAERLTAHVEQAGLRPGDRLPSERALAEQYGVSRSSVRNALVRLEVEGLVEVRHGGGVFVTGTAPGNRLRDLWQRQERLSDISAVREALEVKIAELAAEHSSPDGRALMERALEQMDEDIACGGLGAHADAAFHSALTLASGNPVMVDLMGYVADRIWESRLESLSQPGRPALSLAGHRDIAAAVAAGDVAGAGQAMREHLRLVSTTVAPHA